MNETSFLVQPDGKRGTKVQIRSTKRLPQTTESKHKVEAAVSRNGKSRDISLIQDKYPDDNLPETWQELKTAGIPVVPTLRIHEESGSVFVTDLKADGSEFYGKSKHREFSNKFLRRKKTDDFFLQLTDEENVAKIRNRAIEISKIASKNGILLTKDDTFDLRITPQGDFEVFCLDLTGTTKYKPENYSRDNLEAENLYQANNFIYLLQLVRKKLIQKQQTVPYKLQRIFIP